MMYVKFVQTHFWKENVCALKVFSCALVSQLVCARTCAQLRGNIDITAGRSSISHDKLSSLGKCYLHQARQMAIEQFSFKHSLLCHIGCIARKVYPQQKFTTVEPLKLHRNVMLCYMVICEIWGSALL